MKNIFKTLAVIALGTAMLGFVGCEKPETTPDDTTSNVDTETYDESSSYAIHYNDAAIAAGATINVQPTSDEAAMDFASIELLIENKTDAPLRTVMKIEKLEGPESMNDLMVCYGTTCKAPSCPYTSDVFQVQPGIDTDMAIKFDYSPSKVTSKTVYRMTIGMGTNMDDPQVIKISITR